MTGMDGVLDEAARLFNGKYYFECHDYLEEAWVEAAGDRKAFLQGLIHVSVGMYHVAAANHQGAVNLLSRGLEALSGFGPAAEGLDVEGLLGSVRICRDKSERMRRGEDVSWEPADVPTMRAARVDGLD